MITVYCMDFITFLCISLKLFPLSFVSLPASREILATPLSKLRGYLCMCLLQDEVCCCSRLFVDAEYPRQRLRILLYAITYLTFIDNNCNHLIKSCISRQQKIAEIVLYISKNMCISLQIYVQLIAYDRLNAKANGQVYTFVHSLRPYHDFCYFGSAAHTTLNKMVTAYLTLQQRRQSWNFHCHVSVRS